MTQTDIRPTPESPTAGDGCRCAGPCGSQGRSLTRRTAIGAGIVAGAAFVTACGSSDTATTSSSTAGTSTSTSSTSAAAGSAPAAGSSAAGSSADTAAGSGAAAAGPEIAKLADVPSGGSLIVSNGDAKIALARKADGTVVAHTAICTHQGCAVNAAGATLTCPCHGSVFDAFTGEVTKPPANAPLAEIGVEVSGDAVHLSV